MTVLQRKSEVDATIEPLSGRDAIIDAAAYCFMEAGYTDVSIDDVADRLGATKGMVYHYFRSKADLFFEVHRKGMDINLSTIEPLYTSDEQPFEKLKSICRAHLRNMLESINYQRVVMQGVELHLTGSTTPGQRKKLKLLMKERERYENMIRGVLVEGKNAGQLTFDNASLASKAFLAVLNNPVIWYQPRKRENASDRQSIIDEFTRFAMNSVLAKQ